MSTSGGRTPDEMFAEVVAVARGLAADNTALRRVAELARALASRVPAVITFGDVIDLRAALAAVGMPVEEG